MKLARFSQLTVIVLMVAAFLLCFQAPTAFALSQDIVVTKTIDAPDANLADGKCLSTAGGCTLRAAIMEANTDPDWNRIILNPGKTFQLAGTVLITSNLHIYGGGIFDTFIQGTGQNGFGLFETQGDAHLELLFVTLKNGAGIDGGAIKVGAGTTVNIYASLLENNHTLGDGGAIWNAGSVSLQATTIRSGSAAGMGGGIYNTGELRIAGSTLSDNESTGGDGGALANKGTATITNSTFGKNRAASSGGAIVNKQLATTNLYSTTIAENHADTNTDNVGDGGGVFNSGGTLTAINSLLTANRDDDELFPMNDDCGGTLTSWGSNLISSVRSCSFNDPEGTSLIGVSPQLGILIGNPIATYQLGFGPGVDIADQAECMGPDYALLNDQRGFARTVDGDGGGVARCDAGATEFNAPDPCTTAPPPVLIMTPSPNQISKKRTWLVSWALQDCARAYTITIKQDSKKGPTVEEYQYMNGWEYATKKLARGHAYFVRVTGCHPNGCTNSKWVKFTIQ